VTAVVQVEADDWTAARCTRTGCGYWQHHDRAAGDHESPDIAVRQHVASTGHTVTVTSVRSAVVEYRTSDVFGADADTSMENAA